MNTSLNTLLTYELMKTIKIVWEINKSAFNSFCEEILECEDQEINLIINSEWWDLNQCFAIIDLALSSKKKIKTIWLWDLQSCWFLLFLLGEERVITSNTSILCHQFSRGNYGKYNELLAQSKELENTRERMTRYIHARTWLKAKVIKEVLLPTHDVWLSSSEALEYNIATEVFNFY